MPLTGVGYLADVAGRLMGGDRSRDLAAPHSPSLHVKGIMIRMSAQTPMEEAAPRPSRVIAEALVGRYGPRQITARASSLGLPRQLTNAILAACTATAIDSSPSRKKSPIPAR
jgi:hypothetical protein